FTSPIFLGAKYFIDNTTNTPGTSKDNISGYGGTLGIDAENLYMHFTFIISATHERASYSYTGGSGFEVSLGYRFMISPMVAIGPEFIYQSVKYTKQKDATRVSKPQRIIQNRRLYP